MSPLRFCIYIVLVAVLFMTLDHLYIRFFDSEVVVAGPDEAVDFLKSMRDIDVDDALVEDIHQYYESKMPYPKRYKVRQRCYFIVIKTNATTLEEFKNNASKPNASKKNAHANVPLDAFRPGWYDTTVKFKRVVPHPITGKCSYYDTEFRARLKALSTQDCYDRLLDHLRNRHDVDSRSQFPSIKGKNFSAVYLGIK